MHQHLKLVQPRLDKIISEQLCKPSCRFSTTFQEVLARIQISQSVAGGNEVAKQTPTQKSKATFVDAKSSVSRNLSTASLISTGSVISGNESKVSYSDDDDAGLFIGECESTVPVPTSAVNSALL